MKIVLTLLFLIFQTNVMAQEDAQKVVENAFGSNRQDKFSYHQPVYFIAGDDDLKLQFSFKYRLAKTFAFYFAYTQLMFWDIYKESKPFEDVNYKPELFYRFLEGNSKFFQSVDLGYLHTSNGQADEDSRSLDRVFIRSNLASKIRIHDLVATFMVFNIYNEDSTNENIVDHLGYWEAHFLLTNLIRIERQRLDLEFRTYAGSQIINFDQGGYQIGFLYRIGSDNFNPAIYLQRFEGYSENLLNFNKRTSEWRLGLLLTF